MINTDLDCVTFNVVLEKQGDDQVAYAYEGTNQRTAGYGGGVTTAVQDLYLKMTARYYSFRLVVEDNGQVVQELSYRERH